MNIQHYIDRKREAGKLEHEGNSTDWAGWTQEKFWAAIAGEILDALAYIQQSIAVTKNKEEIKYARWLYGKISKLFDNYSLEALEAACREAEAKHEPEADTPYILYSSDVSLVGENKYAVTVYAWQLINGSLRLIDKFTTPSIPESYSLAEFMAPSSSNLKHNANLVKENATLARDNEELRRQVEAIKQAALKYQKSSTRIVCVTCAFRELDGGEEPCVSCWPHMNACNWQPPDA